MHRFPFFITAIFAVTGTAIILFSTSIKAAEETQSVIIEVEGDPQENANYLKKYYPYIDVVATYDTLFNGLALKGTPSKLSKMESLDFIKSIHPVRTYEALPFGPKTSDIIQQEPVSIQHGKRSANHSSPSAQLPIELTPYAINDTTYTGKGVKVGVVDTGIDYNHPDLTANYVKGYDLVDLDDDPMETKESEGEPTMHGTHVAGIIGANGKMKGVAPDAELYAYRALGPGGMGSSVQVLAALEQAVKDEMDIINLSLGNTVNGPDYPTSVAVNQATRLGVEVVIASGNDGPDDWTVGSPATASKALAVGASVAAQKIPYLYEPIQDKSITLGVFAGSLPWNLEKDYRVANQDDPDATLKGNIALVQRGKTPFYEKAKQAQEGGAIAVIIYNNEPDNFHGSVENENRPINIPVASISQQEGEWLLSNLEKDTLYMETSYAEKAATIADFSSRGPVTVNWDIKPDVIAPGANILSTVPGGYQALQGTSMAAPHVTGVIALLKEAHPNWTTKQIKGALRTTAQPLKNEENKLYEPIMQGMGQIQPKKAIETPAIIGDPLLSFGKMEAHEKAKTTELTIENTTDHEQSYTFDIPKKQPGLSWNIPQAFTLEKNEQKTLPIELRVVPSQLKEGIHQGWLSLKRDDHTYQLPYLFVNETADYPKAMGFEFSLKPFSDDTYLYGLYITDPAKSVEVDLYDPDTLVYQRSFLQLEEVNVGMNEGHIKKSELGAPGRYIAVVTVELEDGTYESYDTELYIDAVEEW